MARALWTGSLSFGLVNVPVQLFSAVRDQDLHFRQLHEKDGSPIETRRFCAEEDEEVPYEEIGHGYELDNGKQVVLTDEDLAAAAPRKTRTIDIEAFVDLADVDPIYFDHPYFLLPAGRGRGHAARLPAARRGACSSSDRAALGRFVLRTKEYLVAVRVRDGLLSLTTMLLPRRDPARQGRPRRRPQAGQGAARPRRRADRGACRTTGTRRATRTATASACSTSSSARRRASASRCPTTRTSRRRSPT